MMELELIVKFLVMVVVTSIITIMGLAIYGIFSRPSLIKKIIALTIFVDAANTFAILVGYRLLPQYELPAPPVLTNIPPTPSDLARFVERSVDPLPQALVITAIVIGLSITAFLTALVLQIYRVTGSTDVRRIVALKAEREV